MSTVFEFVRGTLPLLVSIPHDGRALMPGQSLDMTEAGNALPDTDWHVRRLYDFANGLGASVIGANFSRYVVDLNRPVSDTALYKGQRSTGLCPVSTFDGEDIYRERFEVTPRDRAHRVRSYWRPYHAKIRMTLKALREEFGYALLWDAHSIRSKVPSLFDGDLPELNLGSNDGKSCDAALADPVMAVAQASGYSSVRDGRFKGGYITRHYGDPGAGVHALQLELAQKTYMDEASGEFDTESADRLRGTLQKMLDAFIDSAKREFA